MYEKCEKCIWFEIVGIPIGTEMEPAPHCDIYKRCVHNSTIMKEIKRGREIEEFRQVS